MRTSEEGSENRKASKGFLDLAGWSRCLGEVEASCKAEFSFCGAIRSVEVGSDNEVEDRREEGGGGCDVSAEV